MTLKWERNPRTVPPAQRVGISSRTVSFRRVFGALLVIVAEVLAPSQYLRPFLGVGVLGGYTTFSTYTSDARSLLAAGHGPLALAYVFGTLAACLLATLVGIRLARLVGRRGR